MRCSACDGSELHPKLVSRGVPIYECTGCGSARWLQPDDFRPEQIYDAAYFESGEDASGYDDYAALEPALRRTFARRLAGIPPPRPDARLLDVGAAYGFAVGAALEVGWQGVGLEISRHAACRAARALPKRVAVARVARLPFASACFDAVTLWDVIEHVHDPGEALAEAARVLRADGKLALTTGDVGSWMARLSGARWHLYNLPEHLHFFSREGLRTLLAARGFRVDSMRAEAAYYSLGYLVERLRKTLLGRTSRRGARWPGSRLAIPVNLFDVVLVHATRVREPGP